MKNQAFYARLRNARSLFRFGLDVHSELSVRKKDGTTTPFNVAAVASWNKWANTSTFKSTGKALTRREHKRLARRLYSTKSYRYTSITRSHALALAKSAYPRKAVTIHDSALCKSFRNDLPYWLTTGVTVCNDHIKRKIMSHQGLTAFPVRSGTSRNAMFKDASSIKNEFDWLTRDTAVPGRYTVDEIAPTSIHVNLEDPDSVAEGVRIAKCVLDRL